MTRLVFYLAKGSPEMAEEEDNKKILVFNIIIVVLVALALTFLYGMLT